ncbi:prephenate dehydratase [uncultured Flavobacterium sp.]|uniref:prephenate dehydratase n=1 Tax=uncultured Flavobacterium sp. TaxID=165435 RepID=UPI0030CA33F3|tara:strand:+ start:975 stop:1802 length:828 start_codon:yes stop_codon:yes gene_type:complete
MQKKIAIQGIKGSFHHQVALNYFQDIISIEECMSFDSLVDNLLTNKSNYAVMAIENSIAGSIIPNYALIDKNNLQIIGEYYLSVHHNFLGLKGQKITDILEVHSHPMAILQCKDFFKNYPHIKLVEDKDTAETAKRIYDHQLKTTGAIASKTAAELYELDILEAEIQTINNNQTRFVIITAQKNEINKNEINKVSLKFELEHKKGSLATVLNVMSDCKLNLTKIQSLPKIETPFQYAFFVDFTFDSYKDYEKGKKILEIITTQFKVLGEYKNKKQ